MALSAAARAALEQFKSQQVGSNNSPGMAPPPESDDPVQNGDGAASDASWNRLNDPQTTIQMGGLFRPEQPKTFKESGISYRVLEALLLKIIKQEGPQNEGQLAEVMCVSVNVFRDILVSLNKRELLDTPMPLHYDLTTKGREMVGLVEKEDGYVGPAPVSFEAYCRMVRQQASRERRVTINELEEVFAGYPMREELKFTLKEGFNSQRVMIYYGPPGNGKSLITENLHRLLKEPVLLPYAV